MNIKIEKRGGPRKCKSTPWSTPLILKKKREEGYEELCGYYNDKAYEKVCRRQGLGLKEYPGILSLKLGRS